LIEYLYVREALSIAIILLHFKALIASGQIQCSGDARTAVTLYSHVVTEVLSGGFGMQYYCSLYSTFTENNAS